MDYIIGVDAGTTCFKARLYDREMRVIAQASQEYELIYTDEGFVEVNPHFYWTLLCRLVRTLIENSGVSPDDITGISVSSQGETLICLDAYGRPLRNAIVWTDARASRQAQRLSQRFTNREIFEVTGQREISASWPATKLLWLRENEPETFDKTAHFLLLGDYLNFRLTGCFATDKSLSSSTLYLDIRSGKWWPSMLSEIGIGEERLPSLYESGVPIGNICRAATEDCGLSTRTMVSSGALDQAAGMLGAGNIMPGMLTETTGTCLAVCANIGTNLPSYDKGLLPVHYGLSPDNYYVIFWSGAAGSIYRWIRDVFYRDAKVANLFAVMDEEASAIPPGCDGLMLMPYLSGMQYPVANENASGEFLGARLYHTRGHFTRSALEAVAFLLRQSIEEINRYGITPECIYSLGGGAQSPVWNQIKADVTGLRVLPLEEKECASRGAAILAAVGAGLYKSFADVKPAPHSGVSYLPQRSAEYHNVYASFSKRVDLLQSLLE